MNTFILMAEVFTEPELRSTPDNQNEVASFLVQFSGRNPEEPPSRLKVIGWNNLAKEIMAKKYQKGDRLVVEGRLKIDTVEKNGYKEKRVEMTAQRVHDFGAAIADDTPKFVPRAMSSVPAASVPMASVSPAATPFYPQEDDIPF
jgi:single-strand DNA-binding protein